MVWEVSGTQGVLWCGRSRKRGYSTSYEGLGNGQGVLYGFRKWDRSEELGA